MQNFIEQIKAPCLFLAVLAIETVEAPQSKIEEKDSHSTLKYDFS